MRRPSSRHGFTLVELLIIVAILVALIATMIQIFDPFERKGEAYDAERGIHTRQIYKAINDYLWDQNYPPADFPAEGEYKWICREELTGAGCTADPPSGIAGADISFLTTLPSADTPYMTHIPYDPVYANSQSTGFRLTMNGDRFTTDSPYSGIYHPPPDPIAWWKLDEEGADIGTAIESVEGQDGTHINMAAGNPTADLPPTNFVNNRSLSFDGTNEYIQTPFNDLQTLEDFSIALWFKADATNASHHLIWQGPASQNGWGTGTNENSHEMHISIGRIGTVNDIVSFFYGHDDSEPPGADVVEIRTPFTDTSSWHHVAVSMSNAGSSPQAEFFLDGVSIGTDAGTHGSNNERGNYWDTALRIGRPGADERYFDGLLDDVRLYDVPLTAEQVRLMAEGLF